MSAISGFHTVVPYTGKNKPADDLQRLSVLTFKTPKDKKEDPTYVRPAACCVSIPILRVHTTPSQIELALQQAFEGLQDALIRDVVVRKLEANESIINLHDDQIGFEAIAKWAAENATSGKLTKEAIFDWFDENLADVLTLRLADKMVPQGSTATPEQEKKLAAAVTNYRSTFAAFSAPKAGLSKKVAAQLQKVLALAEDLEHRVVKSLASKLELVLSEDDPELLGL